MRLTRDLMENKHGKIFFCFFWKTLDKHQNLWYNRGTSRGTTKKEKLKMENFPYTMLHFTTWDPEHGERNRESTYRIQSADDLADQMEQMKSAWIFEEFAVEEYHEDAAAVRKAIEAGEHMRAWITQDTEEGEIELARSEMPLADYMAAIADDISWWDAATHAE